jgi:hypothetical protein
MNFTSTNNLQCNNYDQDCSHVFDSSLNNPLSQKIPCIPSDFPSLLLKQHTPSLGKNENQVPKSKRKISSVLPLSLESTSKKQKKDQHEESQSSTDRLKRNVLTNREHRKRRKEEESLKEESLKEESLKEECARALNLYSKAQVYLQRHCQVFQNSSLTNQNTPINGSFAAVIKNINRILSLIAEDTITCKNQENLLKRYKTELEKKNKMLKERLKLLEKKQL